jgi:hypothetical protein
MWLWLVRYIIFAPSINEIAAKDGRPKINRPIESLVQFYAIRAYPIDRVPNTVPLLICAVNLKVTVKFSNLDMSFDLTA